MRRSDLGPEWCSFQIGPETCKVAIQNATIGNFPEATMKTIMETNEQVPEYK